MKSLRVILLEDSPLDAELVLTQLDAEILECEAVRVDGRDAFCQALKHEPDVVLSDYSLPHFDGLSALELTRERYPNVPFIFVSGGLSADLAIDALKRGATDYILKDRLERLLPAVQRALRERAIQRERNRLEKALKESEARYRCLIQAISHVVWAADAEGKIVGGMGGWRSITGKARGSELGDAWLDDLHPKDRERVATIWKHCITHQVHYSCEYRIRTKSGTYRYLAAQGIPLRDEDGVVREWIGICTDITEQKLVETQLRLQTEALAAADREKDRFLAMLGHELRNPLAPVIHSLNLLRIQPSTQETQLRHLDIIERQVRHMARLVDDLLDVSRITRGKIELRRQTMELRPLVEQAVHMALPFIESRRHELSVQFPDVPITLYADPARITQIVGNLLNNAAKYTPEGGQIRLTVELPVDQPETAGGEVWIRVWDNGQGIPPDALPSIFRLFSQLDQSAPASLGGLGIGLTLAKSLAELHHGSIEAYSAGPGQGSEFLVRLPVYHHPVPLPGPTPKACLPPTPAKRRVLLVDDNPDAVMTLAELLECWGHEVLTAADGLSAVSLALRYRPDIAILDIGLPGLNGYEVARRFRQTPDLCHTALVALTGYGQPNDRKTAQEAGFDLHLTKPVDPERIAEAIHRLTEPNRHRPQHPNEI